MMNKYNSRGILKGQGEQVYLYREACLYQASYSLVYCDGEKGNGFI